MRKILIIGMGAGNPDYMTVQAIDALNRVDVFFIPDKGAEKAALRQLRLEICARFIKEPRYRSVEFAVPRRNEAAADYGASVGEWHGRLAAEYAALIAEHLPEGGCGGLLVWGDPSLYDSTIRVVDRIRADGLPLEVEVIPGITAVQALAARHRVVLNGVGGPVLITTGRRLAGDLPDDAGNVVVMLDGNRAFTRVSPHLEMFWGAYLGTENEVLVSGKVSEVAGEIERLRDELRQRNGWIMDTYLLRRPEEP